MFSVSDDLSISVTRGDVAAFSVSAEVNGSPYIFKEGDIVRIKVTEKKACENVIFQKDFPVTAATENVSILLTEEDTKIGDVISKPTDYWYEIELNPYSNPQTIIGYDEDGAKIFKLFPEGKDVEPTTKEEDVKVVDSELDATSQRPVENQAITRGMINLENKLREEFEEAVQQRINELESIDQSYNPESISAQSGKAVSQAMRTKPESVSQLFEFNKYNRDINSLEVGMYVWHGGSTYTDNGGSVNGGYSGWCKIVSIDPTSGFCQVNNNYNLVNNSTKLWVKDSAFSYILTINEAKYIGMLSSVWHTNNVTFPTATSSVNGLMSTSDKTKLDGILRGRLTTTSSVSMELDINHSYLITMSTKSGMTHHSLIYYNGSAFQQHVLNSSGAMGCSLSGTTATFAISGASETVYINYIGF